VDVAGHRDGPSFVGGVGDPVERLGGVLPGGQHPYVVDLSGVRTKFAMFPQVGTLQTRPQRG
jgi:hypothetical protein